MDIREYNRWAWDQQVQGGNPWTQPVSPEVIAAARQGKWSVLLTEQKPVPNHWFPPLEGLDVLCLASGGGQQGPVLAAAGARVSVLDNSPRQLEQDRLVAEREGLSIRTVEGDMRDLSAFGDATFDLIFHPVSNLFCPEVRPVWQECFRVMRSGGILMVGFLNPAVYIFDLDRMDETGELVVRHALPYSDERDLTEAEKQKLVDACAPFEFSHSLEDQIGGQLQAGFLLTDLYEDRHTRLGIAKYMPTYIATRAVTP